MKKNSAKKNYQNQKMVSQRIDPACLMRIKSLELRAKSVVEGNWNGLHRSPYHGFSVEFTEYREYSPGDDPRHIDWKLAARTNQHFIKQFEEETNLCCHMLLDLSSSMQFHSLGYSKADYAKTLAATFAYFLSTQRDASGLIIFDEQVEAVVPARFTRGQLRRILIELERPPQGSHTNFVHPLKHAIETIKKRGTGSANFRSALTDGRAKHTSGISACQRARGRLVSNSGPGRDSFEFQRNRHF